MLEGILGEIPEEEAVWIGGDLNGHIGIDNEGFEEIMGKHGVGSKNEAGERVKDFAREYGVAILNTFFEKRQSQKVTTVMVGLALRSISCLVGDNY